MARDERELGGAWSRFQHVEYRTPADELRPFVARYWVVHWDLRDQPPFRQLAFPYPNVHLAWRNGDPYVTGVSPRAVHRELDGLGAVFGVAFRPGGFRPFLGRSVAELTGRSVPAHELLGPGVPRLTELDTDSMFSVAQGFLLASRPQRDPLAERIASVVEQIAAEPELTTVADVARLLDTGVRRTQRLFAEYVGVPPKWVIRRYRLHEVTQRMAAGEPVNFARLAADLGYADQAHLTRDFAAMTGEPPTHYAKRFPPGDQRPRSHQPSGRSRSS